MKLRNKKTGEIGNLLPYGGEDGKIWVWIDNISRPEYRYNSLAELNKDWEDVPEEPKEYWYLDCYGMVLRALYNGTEWDERRKLIGNYFGTKEEAEKAMEKLKAWKRLESCGFKFKGWRTADLGADKYYFVITAESDSAGKGDLDLLFGGEE